MVGHVHSFESFGTVDGPGIRFVVFMQGCPMRCKYCHNPDTWSCAGGEEYSPEQVAAMALRYKNYFTGGGGVTVTGGEPLLQAEFVTQLFTLLKAQGIHTALDTSGVTFSGDNPHAYDKLLAVTDLVLLDIKHMDEEAHISLTRHSNRSPLAFACYLSERDKPVWIRHVLVPGVTDGEGQLRSLANFVATLKNVRRVEVLPYHTMGEVKYRKLGYDYPLKGVAPPDEDGVARAKQILGVVR